MRRHHVSALGLALVALVPAAGWAQDGSTEGRLAIHGYLTQGYAVSDGTPFYGIRKDGSTDFRYAALQFRYDHGQDDFVLQVNNRRLGQSPITSFESSINLNWAFYEHTSQSGNSALKIGRVPIPRGIYNEQRSIGVVLPFYRAPVIFYDEGAYFSETIDGAVASHTFRADSPWSVDSHLYVGGWSLLSYDQSGDDYAIGRVRAENAIGTQVWLHTPIDGLRIGGAAQRYDWKTVPGDAGSVETRQRVFELQGSIDGSFTKVTVRAESELQHYESDHYFANYLQLGYKLTPKLALNGLGEYAYERAWRDPAYPENFDWHRALGVGLNYKVTPQLVLKAEHHWNKGIQVEEHADPRDPPRFQYTILSASASF